MVEEIDLGAVMTCFRHTIDRLELQFAEMAMEFDGSREWDRAGFNSAADWMRFNCHMNANAAWNAIKVGEQMPELPQTLDAMRAGDIGFAHLATMANTADKVKGFDETQLLPLAIDHSPGKFHYKALHYRHSLDSKGYTEEQERHAEDRCLNLSTAQDGFFLVSGVLDPIGGAAFRAALEPLARPSGEHDDRSRGQRFADAVVDLATRGRPAQLQVTASVE